MLPMLVSPVLTPSPPVKFMLRPQSNSWCSRTVAATKGVLYVSSTVKFMSLHFYLLYCRQTCASRGHAGIVFTQWSKNGFFTPQGQQVALTNTKFGTKVRSPCQISHLSGQKCGNTAPKTVKISNFGHKLAPQGSLVCPSFTKFSDFVCISRWILVFNLVAFGGQTIKL